MFFIGLGAARARSGGGLRRSDVPTVRRTIVIARPATPPQCPSLARRRAPVSRQVSVRARHEHRSRAARFASKHSEAHFSLVVVSVTVFASYRQLGIDRDGATQLSCVLRRHARSLRLAGSG